MRARYSFNEGNGNIYPLLMYASSPALAHPSRLDLALESAFYDHEVLVYVFPPPQSLKRYIQLIPQ